MLKEYTNHFQKLQHEWKLELRFMKKRDVMNEIEAERWMSYRYHLMKTALEKNKIAD